MTHNGPPLFDDVAAAEARRSWEEATVAEREAMTRKDLELYREERAARSVLAIYLASVRVHVEHEAGGAVDPRGLLANATVTRVANMLGAVACATVTGRPRVMVDNNAVTYYAEMWASDDDVSYKPDPVIDPLLEELAGALGCAWRWIGDEAIELVAVAVCPDCGAPRTASGACSVPCGQ